MGKFECDKCDKSYSSKEALEQHKEDYDHSKLEECSNCGEKFSSKESLKEHRRKHWGPVRKTVLGNELAIAGILVGLLLVGGGLALNSMDLNSGSSENGVPEDVDKVIEVSASEYFFNPSDLEVEKGDKVMVKVTNSGRVAHNLRISGKNKGTTTVRPEQTQSFTITITKSGELPLEFECTLPGHAERGMIGNIVSA